MSNNTNPALSVRWVAHQLHNYKKQFLLANVCALAAVIIFVPLPLLLPVLIDEVILQQDGWMLPILDTVLRVSWQTPVVYICIVLLISLMLRLLTLGFNLLQTHLFIAISKRITATLRQRLLAQVSNFSMQVLDTLKSGKLVSNIVNDVDNIDRFIGVTVSNFFISIATAIGVLAVVTIIHPWLGLYMLVLNPLTIAAVQRFSRKVTALKRQDHEQTQLLQEHLTEYIDSAHQLRVSNRERNYLQDMQQVVQRIATASFYFQWHSEIASRSSNAVFMTGFDIFRGACLAFVLFSNLSIGHMFAVFGYLWITAGAMQQIIDMQVHLRAANASFARLQQFEALVSRGERQQYHTNIVAPQPAWSVDIQGLSFSYRQGFPVLCNLSLRIAAGEHIAIAGVSGSGKSTIAQLLCALYPYTSGSILLNGNELSSIDPRQLREYVVCSLQNPALLHNSIYANICLGSNYDEQRIWQALERVQLADLVHGLPEGIHTNIGRQGLQLSGGQCQRLALARLFVTQPSIVILDEVTSAVDNATEQHVLNAMEEYCANTTTIIISHKTSHLSRSHTKYTLDNGVLV